MYQLGWILWIQFLSVTGYGPWIALITLVSFSSNVYYHYACYCQHPQKLLPTGLNWTAFSICFQEAIEGKGFWGYFDGTLPKPTVSSLPAAGEQEVLDQWTRNECSMDKAWQGYEKCMVGVWPYLQNVITNYLARVLSHPYLKDRWDLIKKEVCTHFMDSKCPDKGNICEFLDELHIEKEKLSTYGVTIKDKDYHSTIITSLPNFLSNFTSSLLANVRLHATMGTINPDQLISLISEEVDCGVSQHSWHTAESSKTDDKDEAMLM
ncbi:hypothetical protein L208DRAFT_1325098 [Tricholoma matsutake]|nr:hypothetical protein L208DRAFT_1325098 [Tricholoma matsutake 945]